MDLSFLHQHLLGEIYESQNYKYIYSTDASIYREMPIAVAYPKNDYDIQILINFAKKHQLNLIPRAGGTSLAGQVVGNGIVIDISKYFNHILEINETEHYAWVEPGVIRDDLNFYLKSKSLFFAPETSTSNRACIGGMFGNNSCGGNTLIYNSTRHHIIEAQGFLADGTFVVFKDLKAEEFQQKLQLNNSEGKIYQQIYNLLKEKEVQSEIIQEFPHHDLIRRSMGYAVDELLDTVAFKSDGKPFNFCTLLAGSEGTLAFITKIKVKLMNLPPKYQAVIVVHANSVADTLKGNLVALKYRPTAVELIDKIIIDLSLENKSQEENRFFIDGHPEAIMAVEFSENTEASLEEKCQNCIASLQQEQIGYFYPIVKGKKIQNVWRLRKAGLGILANLKGNSKAIALVEDAAVLPEFLPQYFAEFDAFIKSQQVNCVYYAHISTGEIHKKPILNLKTKEGLKLYREIAQKDAILVKKYRGALSGEHGDGRLRGEFLPLMIGERNYELLKKVKRIFDPDMIFNRYKITDTPKMDEFLKESPDMPIPHVKTYFDYSETGSFMNSVEKCSGSGDCRRSYIFGGAMCPSFQAMGEEKYATRARAHLLREYLTNHSVDETFKSDEIYESLSWCLACKACKSECPSQVDMTKLRAEFLQHYYQKKHIPFRSWLIGYYPIFNDLGSYFSGIYNFIIKNKYTSKIFKFCVGFASKRSLPTISRQSLYHWVKKHASILKNPQKTIYLFCDEFTNRNDVEIGKQAVLLLEKLNYQVIVIKNSYSGRTFLSKGLLKRARHYAEKNVRLYASLITSETPLIGIEPSGILSFRDEYPDLLRGELQEKAKQIAPYALLIDEFIAQEFEKGHIKTSQFTKEEKHIVFHSHCYQKALTDKKSSKIMMEIPENYTVELLEDGCCGMAGAFGYEKEHYEMSQKIGNLVLFPAVKKNQEFSIIAACGTSCRHQIKDGTGVQSYHPLEILYKAII